METQAMPMDKKMKDKLTGFNVRVLDDGSYVLCEEHSDYSKRKESSHETMDSLMAAIKKRMGGTSKSEDDEVSKKY